MSMCRRMTIWHMNQQMANFYQMANTKHLRSWILIMKQFVARNKMMNSKEWKRRSELEGKPIFMSVVNELHSCRVIPACLAVLPKEVTVRHNCLYAIPLVRLGLIAQSLYLHGRTQKRARKWEDVENKVVGGYFEKWKMLIGSVPEILKWNNLQILGMFRRRTNARNVSFRNSLQWTIYINKI